METDGVRLYRTPEGELYPSVTSVLSVNEGNWLQAWRDRVGPEEAARVSKAATDYGTAVHLMCEHLLKNEFDASSYSPIMLEAFSPMGKLLSETIDNIRGNEVMLYSDKLRSAGTTDLVADYEGVPSLIDFKTSRKRKRKSDIPNYFMQGAAYAAMIFERTGVVLKQIVIIMLVEDEGVISFVEPVGNHLAEFWKIRKLYKSIYET